MPGAPWLLRRRSLLFRAESPVDLCWEEAFEPWRDPDAMGLKVGSAEVESWYVLTVARGLNVTVREGRLPRGDVLEGAAWLCWGRRGEDSLAEAILD